MPVPGRKLVAVPFTVATVATVASLLGGGATLTSCHRTEETRGATLQFPGVAPVCEEMKVGDFSGLVFGAVPKARGPFDPPPPPPLPPGTGDNVKFLLAQTYRLSKTAAGVEKELIDACTELGLAAGVPVNELQAAPDAGHGAERACNAASTRVATLFRKARESKIILDLGIEPSHCFVDVEASKKCLSDCGAPVRGGDVRAQCVGGEVDGACQGHCSGACSVSAAVGSGTCHGICSGKCDREFRGTCGGKCTGTCDGAPTRGARRCAGVCDGSCSEQGQGTCIGRCDGQCSGDMEPPPGAPRCAGTCVGVCNGEVREPVCTGDYAPPGVDPVCQAACGAAAAMTARCETPLIRVAVRGGKQGPELAKLLAGIQSAVPKILRIQRGAAKKLPRAIEVASAAAVDWSNAYATAGKHPLLCIRANIDAMKEAATWIDLAVRGAESVGPAIKTEPLLQAKGEDE